MSIMKKFEPKKVYLWRCTKCGRTSNSSIRPLGTYGGKCMKAANGIHRWIKG